jgi:PPOX class probable F420-dependent enzyme
MTDTFSPASRAIFDKKVLAHVASLDADGAPNVTPVWVMLDGDDIVINTARNLASDSRVAVSVVDPDDPQASITVRGTVVTFTTDGADAVIDALAKKYTGLDEYPYRTPGEVRVTVKIRPDRISRQPD